MDMTTLRLFISLARNLHFGKTSQERHMSPSAVSRAIQRLEDQVGHALLIRDNRSVQLTPEGHLFLEFALDVVKRYDSLQNALSSQSEKLHGRLTLFASVTASQSILPNVLAEFREKYPDIHIQLETGYAVNALSKLSEGIDVVVAALPVSNSDDAENSATNGAGDGSRFVKRILMSIPMQTIAPAGSPLALSLTASESPDWSQVPLILPASGQARENIDSWLQREGIKPNVYAEVAGNEAILSLVALGCGVGFVPRLVINDSPLASRVKVIPRGPRLQDFHVGFCTRRQNLANSPIIAAFWHSIP